MNFYANSAIRMMWHPPKKSRRQVLGCCSSRGRTKLLAVYLTMGVFSLLDGTIFMPQCVYHYTKLFVYILYGSLV